MGARLRLLRAAWAGDCGPLSGGAARRAGVRPATRIRADLAGLQGGRSTGRCRAPLLNLLLLGAEALPRGGVVALAGTTRGGIVLTVEGKAAAWPPGLAEALADPGAVPLDNPRAVQPPVAVMLAQAAGASLSLRGRRRWPPTRRPRSCWQRVNPIFGSPRQPPPRTGARDGWTSC